MPTKADIQSRIEGQIAELETYMEENTSTWEVLGEKISQISYALKILRGLLEKEKEAPNGDA